MSEEFPEVDPTDPDLPEEEPEAPEEPEKPSEPTLIEVAASLYSEHNTGAGVFPEIAVAIQQITKAASRGKKMVFLPRSVELVAFLKEEGLTVLEYEALGATDIIKVYGWVNYVPDQEDSID